jgi:hypothetical protein
MKKHFYDGELLFHKNHDNDSAINPDKIKSPRGSYKNTDDIVKYCDKEIKECENKIYEIDHLLATTEKDKEERMYQMGRLNVLTWFRETNT